MKFRHKVVTASSILLLTTVSLLSIEQILKIRSQTQAHIESSVKEVLTSVSNTVQSEMNAKKDLARSTTETIKLHLSDHNYVQNIIEAPTLNSRYTSIGLGYDNSGVFVENLDEWEPDSSYDPRQRPWFIDAKSKRELVVTEPYADVSTKNVIISVGTPIEANGQFQAAMVYDIELSNLSKLVNQVNLFDAGYLFLVAADGMTIAHPDSKLHGEKLSHYLPQISLTSSTQQIELNNKLYMVSLTHIPSEDWYLGAVIDETIAYADVAHLRNSAITYSIIAVIASIIALTMLIRTLMRPLDTLNKAIKDVASGKGDLTHRLNTNTDPEFSELARNFNTFIENLQHQIIESKDISEHILSGTQLTVQGSKNAVSAIQTQLEELEQLATAMHEMSVTANDVANNANGAANAAKEADQATLDGSAVVRESTQTINLLSNNIDLAVEEVHVLESATANIETILKVINDIADQTNLLALNAAIEASRAGESGR